MVVDGEVDVLPAGRAAGAAGRVEAPGPVAARGAAADPFAGASRDPAELLDVDMHELARPRAFVADRLLEPQPAESTDAVLLQHR